uniref:capsule assembly Wzi family protein n=1 Tax=Roseivirga sp. TaxID=1964215 RepID=UPI004048C890
MLLKIIFRLFLLSLSITTVANGVPRDTLPSSVNFETRHGILTSSNGIPFWTRGNNSQRFKPENQNLLFTSLFLKKESAPSKRADILFGLELMGAASKKFSGSVIQSYVGASYSKFIFTMGIKEETFGLSNEVLGFGNLVNGTNARPISKISIQSNGWIPLVGSYISVKGYLAHGWLEKNRYQSKALLHQKYLYFKFQAKSLPAELNFGITHNAHWGGANAQSQTSQPADIRDFFKVFTASKAGENGLQTDQINAIGNHLGTWDMSSKFQLGHHLDLTNYIQWLWEDGSGLKPKNWNAGVYGLSLNSNKAIIINHLGVEYINTTNQGGSLTGDGAGPDDYLNNSVYKSGWTYRNQVIGSPIFLLFNSSSQLPNRIKNVIEGLSIYARGTINDIRYGASFREFYNSGNKTDLIYPALTVKSISSFGEYHLKKRQHILFQVEYNWSNFMEPTIGFRFEFKKDLSLIFAKKTKQTTYY